MQNGGSKTELENGITVGREGYQASTWIASGTKLVSTQVSP